MIGAALRWIERGFVFYPERTLKGTPDHLGLEWADVWFKSADGVRLNGWWVPGRTDTTWLFFHGNGGNVSSRLDNLLGINRWTGASVFTFDYRGFGLSEGRPDEPGTHRDAAAALSAMLSRIVPRRGRVVYFGRSMGCAVATRLAATEPPDALVLESPPPSVPSVAHLQVPWMRHRPLQWLMRNRFETVRHIRSVHVPVLVIHGENDHIVPPGYGKAVFDCAREPKRWLLVPGAGHDRVDTVNPGLYYGAVNSFLSKYLRSGAADQNAAAAG
jgi:hypothetical protein